MLTLTAQQLLAWKDPSVNVTNCPWLVSFRQGSRDVCVRWRRPHEDETWSARERVSFFPKVTWPGVFKRRRGQQASQTSPYSAPWTAITMCTLDAGGAEAPSLKTKTYRCIFLVGTLNWSLKETDVSWQNPIKQGENNLPQIQHALAAWQKHPAKMEKWKLEVKEVGKKRYVCHQQRFWSQVLKPDNRHGGNPHRLQIIFLDCLWAKCFSIFVAAQYKKLKTGERQGGRHVTRSTVALWALQRRRWLQHQQYPPSAPRHPDDRLKLSLQWRDGSTRGERKEERQEDQMSGGKKGELSERRGTGGGEEEMKGELMRGVKNEEIWEEELRKWLWTGGEMTRDQRGTSTAASCEQSNQRGRRAGPSGRPTMGKLLSSWEQTCEHVLVFPHCELAVFLRKQLREQKLSMRNLWNVWFI